MSRLRISVCLTLLVTMMPGSGWGAFGVGDIVFDPTNYIENLATAINTADTLIEAIEISEHTLLNIMSLEEVIIASGSYMSELAALWVEAEGVLRSMQRVSDQFDRLFGTGSLPLTAYAYSLRRSEIYQYRNTAAQSALRVQMLINSTVNLIDRILRFINSIAALVGGKQATLTVLQAQLETVHILQRSDVRQAALDHLKVIESMDEGSSIESLKLINDDAWKNW
jgi:conjugal transfer/entry exclusion protein